MRYDGGENASTLWAMEAVRRYDTRYGSVSLRPETVQDEAFLYALFHSHTAGSLSQAGLDATAKETLVRIQFRAQNAAHRSTHPYAVYSIIESDGVPIGRLIEADEGDCVYFVDFALLPERQARGLGTAFIEQVANEWAAKGRAARVEIQCDNAPSLKLCQKLGFDRVADTTPGYVNLLRPGSRATGFTVQTSDGPVTLARLCDGCTLCCRVLEATTLNKPMGVLCQHCIVGQGCGIRETRGRECRDYHCGWLLDGSLGPEWHPETAHIVITYDLEGRRLNAHADPLHPDAWLKEPYYTQLKNWAAMALPRNGQVVAYLGKNASVFLPDRHVELGFMGLEDYIFIEHLPDGGWDARKVSEMEAVKLRDEGRAA